MKEAHPLLESILVAARPLSERVHAALTWIDQQGRSDRGMTRELIDTLLPETEAAGEARGAAWLRFHLGWLHIDTDGYQEGLAIIEAVKGTFEDLGDGEGIARCCNALGVIYVNLGVYDLALDCYRDSAKEAEKVGLKDLIGTALMNMADCLYELGEPEEALRTFERCVQEGAIPPRNLPVFHRTAGFIYRALGRPDEAEQGFLQAIQASKGWLSMALAAREALAELYIESGRLDKAHALVKPGIEEASGSNDRYIGAKFRLVRARLFLAEDHAPEAILDIETAITMVRALGLRRIEADAEKAAFTVWQACGEHAKALAALLRHHELMDAMKSEQTAHRIYALRDDHTRREVRHFEDLFKQISLISEIGRRITANLDLEITLASVYGLINEIMDAPSLGIAVIDEEKACLDYRLVMMQGERKEPFSTPLGTDSFGCWCISHRSDILMGDIELEQGQYLAVPPSAMYGNTEKSLVFVPLLIRDKVLGMLTVQSPKRNAYDKRTVETVRAIGAYIAIAIENARLFTQVLDSEKSLRREHTALLKAQAELKHLCGIIPICSACKKIRDDGGSWHQLESYIRDHSEAKFTHGICPDCAEEFYGDVLTKKR